MKTLHPIVNSYVSYEGRLDFYNIFVTGTTIHFGITEQQIINLNSRLQIGNPITAMGSSI